MSLKSHSTSAKYGLMPDNHDDRRSLELLVNKLFDKPPVSSTTAPSKTAQPGFSKYSRNKHKAVPKSYDPKGWLKKEKTAKNFTGPASRRSKKKQPEKEKQMVIDDDCRKYGIELPTLEEVLAMHEKLEKDIHYINNLLSNIEPIPAHFNVDVPEPAKDDLGLNCKHLTDLEIDNACKKNYQYVHDIHTGARYSNRYELFWTNGGQNNFHYKNLRYNTSMITFSYKQKERLLAFLNGNFCHNIKNTSKTLDYLFKVLLPELCLKIFMDVHDMDQTEAVKYLETQPLD